MLSVSSMITQPVSGKIRVWIQDLDLLTQVCLVPMSIFIAITLENDTNLILDSKQFKE